MGGWPQQRAMAIRSALVACSIVNALASFGMFNMRAKTKKQTSALRNGSYSLGKLSIQL